MNVSIEKESKPVFPEWLMKLSLCEVKKRLYEGTLTDSLQHDLVDCDDHIVAIRYRREKHNRILGFSILILIFEFKAKAARRTYKKEVFFDMDTVKMPRVEVRSDAGIIQMILLLYTYLILLVLQLLYKKWIGINPFMTSCLVMARY